MLRNFMPNMFDSVITANIEEKKKEERKWMATGGVKDVKTNECDATGKKCLWCVDGCYVLLLFPSHPDIWIRKTFVHIY